MVASPLILFAILIAPVLSANDWSKPCFQGECSYDLPKANGSESATGTIRIWGSQNAIADVTTAGGWEIIGCSSTALSQDIRIICRSDDAQSACDHLYENGGAVNKIVRLPENCGANPFARISRAWVPDDQTIPTETGAKIVRRDGSSPQVKALSIDVNFAAANPTTNGNVNVAIHGMNAPGYKTPLGTAPLTRRRNRRRHSVHDSKRGLGSFIRGALKSFTKFDVENSAQLPLIDVNEALDLVDKSLDCGPVKASFKAHVDAKAHAVVDIGIVATGTLIPPKLDQFNAFAGLSAELDGTLSLVAEAIGELSTGEIRIFEVGIPGLSFPGILQVGPSFQVDALAKASLDVKLDLEVGLNYQIKNARLNFPPNDKQTGKGSFGIVDTPLKLSVSPSVEASGTLEAHLIPRVSIGLQAFEVIKADVFINVDAAVLLELSLKAGANIEVNTIESEESAKKEAAPTAHAMESAPSMKEVAMPVVSPMQDRRTFPRRHLAVIDVRNPASNELSRHRTAVANNVDSIFGGCIALLSDLSVNVGASGDFLGLFNEKTSFALFKREFELFKRCFGDNSAGSKRSNLSSHAPDIHLRQDPSGLVCAASQIPDTTGMVDGIVKATDINATSS